MSGSELQQIRTYYTFTGPMCRCLRVVVGGWGGTHENTRVCRGRVCVCVCSWTGNLTVTEGLMERFDPVIYLRYSLDSSTFNHSTG